LAGLSSCAPITALEKDSEKECDAQGQCRTTYISQAMSGRAITLEGTLGVFALSSVSLRDHGTLQLTFYRLRESSEVYRVQSVQLLSGKTMTDGRAIDFQGSNVSITVSGAFDYFSYAPAIPIEVGFASSTHNYVCGITLESTRTYNYMDAVRGEPTTPRTVAQFLALPPPTPNPDPHYPHPQVDPDKLGCKNIARH
jgi:hypothetical protein